MQTIPHIFLRDTADQYTDITNPECDWVFKGKGTPTEQFDGRPYMILEGKLYKRFKRQFRRKDNVAATKINDFRPGPVKWLEAEPAPIGKIQAFWPGWAPTGPKDKEAWEAFNEYIMWSDGTYELVGPTVNNNPYGLSYHRLLRHGSLQLDDSLVDRDNLTDFFADNSMEGLVWHHPDGRMAKAKRIGFGLTWPPS